MRTNQMLLSVFVLLILGSGITSCSHSHDKDATQSTTMATPDSSQMKADSIPEKKPKASTQAEVLDESQKIVKDKYGIYNRAEVMPQFPGGQTELENYIQNNIHYPSRALNNGIEGTVYVHFAIDEEGKVIRDSIMNKPLGYGLEEEALRAINDMPAWTPGKIRGKKVKTYLTLPVHFKLEGV